jgi:hypothetical protein
MMVIFFISALAETNRPPFDLPEAESELVAGYQVEYSSTPYLLFMIGEYMNIVLMCALTSILFFGGWLSPIPGLPDGVLWMAAKIVFFFFIFAMVKAIVPRYRYDQLMRIGWKVFLPLSLAWVVIVAFLAQFGAFGGAYARWDPTDNACVQADAAFGGFLEAEYGATSNEATVWREGAPADRWEAAAAFYYPAADALWMTATPESQETPGGPLVLRDDLGLEMADPAQIREMAEIVLLSGATESCLRPPGTTIMLRGTELGAEMDADFPAARRAAIRRYAASLAGR